MSILSRVTFAMFILLTLVFGQTPSRLSFEVATIKPSEPITPAAITSGKLHLGVNIQGSRVDIGFLSLAELIPIAFNVKPYQVSCPDWMKTQRFDILAKMAEGATKEQMPQMLQALLEERFQLKVHRENREHGIYALVVAKGGPKLKESPAEIEAPRADDPANPGIRIGNNEIRVNSAPGGATVLTGENRSIKMAMGQDGQMRMELSQMTMPMFAEVLTRFSDRPVMDMTELTAKYEVALNLSMESMMAIARAQGMGVGGALPNLGARGEPARVDATDPSGNSSILQSVQQLGLRLDPRKAPVEFVVVDHMEKMPSEN